MNIYISNLDLQFTDEDLKNLFVPFGSIQSAAISMDAFTDKSRGFGYVDMPNQEEARAAIAALDQAEVNGRKLTVKEAEPKEQNRGSYNVGNGGIRPYRFKNK